MANGVNANQVRRWMRERGIEPPTRRIATPVLDTASAIAPAFVQLPMKVLVHDGYGVWLANRRLNQGRFQLRPGDGSVALTRGQFEALILGLSKGSLPIDSVEKLAKELAVPAPASRFADSKA